MRVISVDPGYDRIGVAVLELANNTEKLLFSACIETERDSDLNERLLYLGLEFEKLIEKYSPNALAIETLFFNKNIKTAIGVAAARGVLIYIAKRKSCAVKEFSPQEIKIAVTGYGKSDKKAVIDMVKRLIPKAPADALDDEYDAIATGITHLAHHRGNQ